MSSVWIFWKQYRLRSISKIEMFARILLQFYSYYRLHDIGMVGVLDFGTQTVTISRIIIYNRWRLRMENRPPR